MRSMIAAPIEWPISTGGDGKRAGDVLDIGDVVVETGDEQRFAAAARAVAAQAQRMRGVARAANQGRK